MIRSDNPQAIDNAQTIHKAQAIGDLQIARLRGQFVAIQLAFPEFDEAAWNQAAPDGKWSARQHLAHLARYHDIFQERLTRILKEESPRFGRYSAEEDADWPMWESLSPDAILDRLAPARAQLVALLEEIPSNVFSRRGNHPSFGDLTVADWLEFFLVHEGHHMYAIFKLLRSAPERNQAGSKMSSIRR